MEVGKTGHTRALTTDGSRASRQHAWFGLCDAYKVDCQDSTEYESPPLYLIPKIISPYISQSLSYTICRGHIQGFDLTY